MVKIRLQRRDGIIQTYNVKSRKKYQKLGKKTKSGANIYIGKRTRQQVVYNGDYGNSLRAFSFNNNFSERELEDALDEFLLSNPKLINLSFDTAGFEDEEISTEEDLALDPKKIHLQLNDSDVEQFKIKRPDVTKKKETQKHL